MSEMNAAVTPTILKVNNSARSIYSRKGSRMNTGRSNVVSARSNTSISTINERKIKNT